MASINLCLVLLKHPKADWVNWNTVYDDLMCVCVRVCLYALAYFLMRVCLSACVSKFNVCEGYRHFNLQSLTSHPTSHAHTKSETPGVMQVS